MRKFSTTSKFLLQKFVKNKKTIDPGSPAIQTLNTKIFLYLWFLLILCASILNTIVFTHPYWFGHRQNKSIKPTENSESAQAVFGLYNYCFYFKQTENPSNRSGTLNLEDYFKCYGSFTEFKQILNVFFKISTLLVFFASLLGVFSIAVCFLGIFFSIKKILLTNSILQFTIGILFLLACVIYPFGWSDVKIKNICESNIYIQGNCEVKWSFILAIVQAVSSVLLAMIGVVLRLKSNLVEHKIVKEKPGIFHSNVDYVLDKKAKDGKSLSSLKI